MFEDGFVAQAVNEVVGNGVVYVTSAGNVARRSYESDFNPGSPIQIFGRTEIPHIVDQGTGSYRQRLTIPEDDGYDMWFQWDEPFFSLGGSGAATDLNVYLVPANSFLVLNANSTSQLGMDAQFRLQFTNETNFTEFDLIVTSGTSTTPNRFKYYAAKLNFFDPENSVPDFDDSTFTNSGTIFGHANAAGAITVGAADYRNTPLNGVNPAELQGFSSAGSNVIPGRMKPDLVAPDNVDTTFFLAESLGQSFDNLGNDLYDPEANGLPNFAGTSAAAPHIAGLVALMLEANPSLTPAQVRDALTSTASDMDDPFTAGFDTGFDHGTGHGFVNGTKALAKVLPPKVMNLTIGGQNHDDYDFHAEGAVGSGEQIRTIPVGAIDEVMLTFSEPLDNLVASDLRMIGIGSGTPVAWSGVSSSIDPLTGFATYTWTLQTPITAVTQGDYYLLSMSDDVLDLDGDALDGEWVNPISLTTPTGTTSVFPSGDNQPGGTFNFIIGVLPADSNQNGTIDRADLITVQNYFGLGTTFVLGDGDGDGDVDLHDLITVQNHFGTSLGNLLLLLADLDGNDKVDGDDEDLLLGNLGEDPETHAGDLDGDGDIDLDDLDFFYAIWGLA